MARPTLLTDEVHQTIITELLDASTTVDAAAMAGVCVDTVRRWVREGVRAQREFDEKGTPIPPEREAMVRFSAEVKMAKATARKEMLGHIRRAAPGQWQAAAWWLERTAPEEYGRQIRQEVSGPQGGAIRIEGNLDEAIAAAIAATPGMGDDDDEP